MAEGIGRAQEALLKVVEALVPATVGMDSAKPAGSSRMTAEEAAGLIAGIRRRYRRHYRVVAEGRRSSMLLREVTNARKALARLLRSLDCPPRATWIALLAHYETLEARLELTIAAIKANAS